MRYLIIGGSAAAISAVEAIRAIDARGRIDLFTDESTPLFSRVLLPYYVAEELGKQLLNFRNLTFFEDYEVNAHIGVKITKIDPSGRTVKASDGNTYEYDRVLIATGGNPIVPPIPGVDKQNISTLKTMADAERVYTMKGKSAVVIGAGSIGVESAISLSHRGIKVTLLEQLGRVMPTVFDREAAEIVQRRVESFGIDVICGERAVEFSGNGKVSGVRTNSREIPCDMVVMGIGVQPNTELAQKAGAALGSLGGIQVDERMRTSVSNVFAAGDVCETYDIAMERKAINAIWPCAMEQGKIAGRNMAGIDAVYPGSVRMNSIGNFIGQPAISLGMIAVPSEGTGAESGGEYQEVVRKTKDTYRKLILKDGRIKGAILVGDTQKAGIFSVLLKKQVDVSEFTPMLLSHSLSFMDIIPLVREHADKFFEPEFKELMDTHIV